MNDSVDGVNWVMIDDAHKSSALSFVPNKNQMFGFRSYENYTDSFPQRLEN